MQRILFLSANPRDTTRLQLDKEFREIRDALRKGQKRDNFCLELCTAVRPCDIRRALLEFNPHIIHFSGHGEKENGLALEGESSIAKWIDGDTIAELISFFPKQTRCVILNACYSNNHTEEISCHVPYVIGMSSFIGDIAATAFSVGFYEALVSGRGIEDAYKFGRNAIKLEYCEHNISTNRKEIDASECSAPVLLKQKAVDQRRSLSVITSPLLFLIALVSSLFLIFNISSFSVSISDFNSADQHPIASTINQSDSPMLSNLTELLKAEKYEEADIETLNMMCSSGGVYSTCSDIPYSQRADSVDKVLLRKLNTVWLKNTNGKHSFSVQKRIFLKNNGILGKYQDIRNIDLFSREVGWKPNWFGKLTCPEPPDIETLGNLPCRATLFYQMSTLEVN